MDAHASGDADSTPPIAHPGLSDPRRLFLHEPGWRIGLKVGSEREFCYMMAPGQEYYHRLLDGEIYLTRDEEKLCFACAERRGLVSYEPRSLLTSARRPLPDLEPPAPA